MIYLNNFTPNEFLVTINRLPNVSFKTQTFSIPAISGSPPMQPGQFNKVFHSYDTLEYSPFDLGFIIDEDLSNYIEIFNWMKGLGSDENFSQYKNLAESADGIQSDIIVTVVTNAKNPSYNFIFKNCMPISLSGIELNTSDTDAVTIQGNVSFQYDYFTIEKVNQ